VWLLALLLQTCHFHAFGGSIAGVREPASVHLTAAGQPGHDSDHCPACQMAGVKAEPMLLALAGRATVALPSAWLVPVGARPAAAPFLRSSPPRAPPATA
jgi:hypothetical protein